MSDFDLNTWIHGIQDALDTFKGVDIGYPKGDNYIRLVSHTATLTSDIPDSLVAFYTLVEEVVLVDIFVGYFLHSLNHIYARIQSNAYPKHIDSGYFEGDIFTFGSTGGGDAFAIHFKTENIVMLRSDSLIGTDTPSDLVPIKPLAVDFNAFLFRLLDDVIAFVHDRPDWQYMV